MTGPMVILAFLSVVSGFVGTPIRNYFAEFVVPSAFAAETLALEPEAFSFVLAALSVAMAVAGIALAYAFYVPKPEWASSLAYRFSSVYTFLDKGWYFDDLYDRVFVRPAIATGRFVREFDRRTLSGLISGVGRGFLRAGERLRPLQTGGVQNYALFILLSVLVLGVIVGAIAGAQYAFLMVALIAVVTLTAVAVGARL
jgi:NADH:ubiquinone oxidoreductase subunit 5 (subunit L)/multisubunit Na+/H+ antiporter MnhA subunit